MKTPIKELIDEVNHKMDYLIQKQLEDERYRTINYDVTIKVLGEIESILRQSYLDKEKEVIMKAFDEGENDALAYKNWGKIKYDSPEDYYNETFNNNGSNTIDTTN